MLDSVRILIPVAAIGAALLCFGIAWVINKLDRH